MNTHIVFFALFGVYLPLIMAQAPTSTSNGMPTPTDQAHDSNQGPSNTTSLVNYYFVFLALVVCFAGLTAFLMYKRKKKYGSILLTSRETALQRDLDAYDATRARRRYWQGRWRSADNTREEGLNEFGEAPPPYMPKNDNESSQQNNTNEPAVPMQTLSREQAGFKPPEYTATRVQPATENTWTATITSNGTVITADGTQRPQRAANSRYNPPPFTGIPS